MTKTYKKYFTLCPISVLCIGIPAVLICLDLSWFICDVKRTGLILFRHKGLECAVNAFVYRYIVLVRFIVVVTLYFV